MTMSNPDPPRWQQGVGDDGIESKLGELVANVERPTRLSDHAKARILSRLSGNTQPKALFSRTVLAAAVAALVLGASGALAVVLRHRGASPAPLIEATEPKPPHAQAPIPEDMMSDPAFVPALLPPSPVHTPTSRPTKLQRPTAAAPERQPAEAALLALALRQLEVKKDPAAALATLERLHARFPSAQLHDESLLVQVGAEIALQRHDQALTALDAQAAWHRPSHRRLAAVRGELRARGANCEGALADFAYVLQSGPGDDLDQRALRGVAHCRARLGDQAEARAALELYLQRFPLGRFAAEIRQKLSNQL